MISKWPATTLCHLSAKRLQFGSSFFCFLFSPSIGKCCRWMSWMFVAGLEGHGRVKEARLDVKTQTRVWSLPSCKLMLANHHRVGGLEQHSMFSLSGGQRSASELLTGCVLGGGCVCEDTRSVTVSWFVAPGAPWHFLASSITPVPASVTTWPPSLLPQYSCMCSSFMKTLDIWALERTATFFFLELESLYIDHAGLEITHSWIYKRVPYAWLIFILTHDISEDPVLFQTNPHSEDLGRQ